MRNNDLDLNQVIRYIGCAVEILLCCVIQGVPGLIPEVFTVVPLLSVASALTISLLETEIPSMFFGLECGLLLDVTGPTPFGASAIVMIVICTLLSAATKKRKKHTLWYVFSLLMLATSVAFAGFWLINIGLRSRTGQFEILINRFLPMMIYTYITTPVFYLINSYIHKGLKNRY